MNATVETEACRNSTEHWINIYLHPRKTVDRVEDCVIVAAVFMIVLAILSPRRRQSQSIIVRYGVEGVFALSFPLISYTFGLMGGQIFKSQLYPVWGIFLGMLFGGTIAMSVQKLDEIKQPVKLYCYYILFIGVVLGTIIADSKGRPSVWFVAFVLDILLVFKVVEQVGAALLASKPSSLNGIKWLDIYMKHEHQLSTSYDPRTIQGYKYAVLIHLQTPVKLDTIWCGNIGVLSSSNCSPPIRRLKDLCLSFALFHLMVRRYFGYTCPESKLGKTRALVLHGLLRTEEEYERAFQVIEAELAFLYDFFFTKYAFTMYGGEVWLCALSLTLTFASIAVCTWSLSVLDTHPSLLDDRSVEISTRNVMITKAVLGVLSIFQLLQVWSYCVSDWAKVSWVCNYVTRPAWQGNSLIEKLLLFIGRPHKWLRYWRNDLGQYSVLDSYSSSWWDRLKHLLPDGKAGKPVELSVEVKKAVAWAIKNSINGHLSNGASALMRHGMSDELCWACLMDDEFTLTHIILVWHVATSYCEISEMVTCPNEIYVHSNRGVATSLSKYCAYLVAFVPTFLPGSAIESECTLADLEREAKITLLCRASPREKYEKLMELQNVGDAIPSNAADATAGEAPSAQLLSKGVMLGKVLESMGNRTVRWDLLAEFWAEMLVYIAPSDNVAAHIELLPQGGEFVTHVWALLMHAGILERPAATAIP